MSVIFWQKIVVFFSTFAVGADFSPEMEIQANTLIATSETGSASTWKTIEKI
jgi:hypothetical protein